MKDGMLVRHERVILIGVILLGLALRLYGITLPLVDSYHQRQTQTAMVARNLYENGMNIFYTQYDIYGNSPGYAILEFPLLNALVALLYFVFGVHEIIGRLIALSFSVGAMFLMHRLARKFLPPGPALAATAMYALSPMNIYFSRTFMPESPMMFFTVGAVYFFLEWLDKPRAVTYIAATVFAALAFLVKMPTLLILVPISCAWFARHRRHGLLRAEWYVYLLLVLTPVVLWALHASRVNAVFVPQWSPESIITTRGGSLALRFSTDFYLAILKSIVFFLLTPPGFLLMLLGVIAAWTSQARHVLYGWLVAVLAYFFAFAEINMGHHYYQLPLLPPAALLLGCAVGAILERYDLVARFVSSSAGRLAVAALLIVLLVGLGANYVVLFSSLYDVEERVPYHLEAAQVIRQRTATNEVLILNDPPNALNTTLTYYAHRKSWPFPVAPGEQAIHDLEELRAQGGTVYVAIDSKYGRGVEDSRRNKLFWSYLTEHYTPIVLTDHYIVFDLSRSQ